MPARMIKSAVKYSLNFLPRTRPFDFLYSLIYFIYVHRRFPRRNSGLFNDYLFYLKNSSEIDDALRQITTDKVYAKFFIDEIVGHKVTPETYAVFTSVEEIRRSELPERCVLKPAHAGGAVVSLEDADAEIFEADYEVLRLGLASDLYTRSRERNYKNLRKRIICEELIEKKENVTEYKFFCRSGVAKFLTVNSGFGRNGLMRKQNIYDSHWNRIDVVQKGHRPQGEWAPMPSNFILMRETVEKIAQHFESVRVDLYVKGDRFYVGELTHCHRQAHAVFRSIREEREISRIFFG